MWDFLSKWHTNTHKHTHTHPHTHTHTPTHTHTHTQTHTHKHKQTHKAVAGKSLVVDDNYLFQGFTYVAPSMMESLKRLSFTDHHGFGGRSFK